MYFCVHKDKLHNIHYVYTHLNGCLCPDRCMCVCDVFQFGSVSVLCYMGVVWWWLLLCCVTSMVATVMAHQHEVNVYVRLPHTSCQHVLLITDNYTSSSVVTLLSILSYLSVDHGNFNTMSLYVNV